MEFSDRLQYVIDFKKMKQKDVARGVDVDRSRISKWLSGKIEVPRRDTAQKLAEFFECNIEWLATGKGEIWPSDDPITEHPKKKKPAELDDELLLKVQAWLNDMEKQKPGFKSWFRLEFENRFPEFSKKK